MAGETFEAVILATSPSNVPEVPVDIQLLATKDIANDFLDWLKLTASLPFEAITTVYAWGQVARLRHPMLALRSGDRQ